MQRYIAEPSFNFPDLLDITRGCHAAYKRPRINDLLVHYENVTFYSKISARRDKALNSILRELAPLLLNLKKRSIICLEKILIENNIFVIFKSKYDIYLPRSKTLN